MVTVITSQQKTDRWAEIDRRLEILDRQSEIAREMYGIEDISTAYFKDASSHLKSDAKWCAGAIGLIALGTRGLTQGLKRLRAQTAQHSIRWYKNPTLPIYAGFGIILCSTIIKIMHSAKINQHIISKKQELHNLRVESSYLRFEDKYGSTLKNKS